MVRIEIPFLKCRQVMKVEPYYELSVEGICRAVRQNLYFPHCRHLLYMSYFRRRLYINPFNVFRALKSLPPSLWHIIRFNRRLARSNWYYVGFYQDITGKEHCHQVNSFCQ